MSEDGDETRRDIPSPIIEMDAGLNSLLEEHDELFPTIFVQASKIPGSEPPNASSSESHQTPNAPSSESHQTPNAPSSESHQTPNAPSSEPHQTPNAPSSEPH
ncbi:hypothetical protein M8J76_000895 [Diaphorina citri]|nr:hypothetical protein M8J76_000895 [Diaphorina citri]